MKRNILNKVLLHVAYLIPILFASSCIEEFNADLGEADTNILVVEGNILPDTICEFHLSRSAGINEPVYPTILGVNNAEISITGSDGSNYQGKFDGSGKYSVKTGKFTQEAKYSLVIKWDGATFSSDPATPLNAPDITSMKVEQPRTDLDIDVLVTNESPKSNDYGYYRWTFAETWEVNTKFKPNYEYDPATDRVVDIKVDKSRGWGHDINHNIIIANASKFQNSRIKDFRLALYKNYDLRFQTLYCIDVKQYAISRAQYEYELARQELSDQLGGMFAPQPSEMFSNIKSSDKKHRVVGYVGVCGKISNYRLWVKTSDVQFSPMLFRNIEITEDEDIIAMSNREKYNAGFRIANVIPAMMMPWDWVPRNGVDATQFGCTLEKPSYWPN